MNTKKINIAIWVVMATMFLIIMLMHPRIYFGFIFLICLIQSVSLIASKREQGVKMLWKKTLLKIICIIFGVWIIAPLLNVFYPYHAVYEYKNDIRNLKTKNTQDYLQFPDIIPDSATHVKWVCIPSYMQGSGYDALFFCADASYIDEIYNRYISSAMIYLYEEGEWINKEIKKAIFFPKLNDISVEDGKNVCVMIMVDNDDINHPHISGLYINRVDGYVCYFVE